MKNFYFIDNETSEDFIVEANDYHEAVNIASRYFDTPCFEREISDYEAEMLGVDTYQKGEKWKLKLLVPCSCSLVSSSRSRLPDKARLVFLDVKRLSF